MRLQPGQPLHVMRALALDGERPVGRLAFDAGTAVFEYDDAFIASGERISPVWTPPTRSVIRAQDRRTFRGLHGMFADSLPDAWGLELMRRRLAEQGQRYDALTELDKLALVGSTGVGALVYRPDYAEHEAGPIDIDVLAHGAIELDGTPTHVVEELARLGGASGGARPKVFVARNDAGDLVAGSGEIPDGYDAYIVKFKQRDDRADIGPVEAVYADMARAAGLIVAPTLLIAASKGPGYFATQRFDRGPGNRRVHVVSAAALLERDWANVAIDYAELIAFTMNVTRDQEQADLMFRRMVFNVLALNGDDHLKQHTFLQRPNGEWILAPAYDLTFSSGPNGERYCTVNGKGRDIMHDDILAVARAVSIKEARARHIIDEVAAAVSEFSRFADTYGVSKRSVTEVNNALRAAHISAQSAPAPTRRSRRPRE